MWQRRSICITVFVAVTILGFLGFVREQNMETASWRSYILAEAPVASVSSEEFRLRPPLSGAVGGQQNVDLGNIVRAGYIQLSAPKLREIEAEAWETFFSTEAENKSWRDSTSSTRVVIAQDFRRPWYQEYLKKLGLGIHFHRKQWEFLTIARSVTELLAKNNSASPLQGRIGYGFAVGKEPLGSYFVAQGARVVVSDAPPLTGVNTQQWAKTQQFASSVEETRHAHLVDRDLYHANARYEHQDMRHLPQHLLKGEYDFVWSCSSLEHQGTIELDIAFLENTVRMLRPGGVSVHTTEFMVSHMNRVFEQHDFSILRKKDIEEAAKRVEKLGGEMTVRDYFSGAETVDLLCDTAPYKGHQHLKLMNQDVCHTSILIVIKKQR